MVVANSNSQLTADFSQFWVLESKVPGLLET